MLIEDDVKLDFDDVLMKPKRSLQIKPPSSRAQIVVTKKYEFLHSGAEWEGCPIFAANMDTTGTFAMARALAKKQMGVCLNKHYSLEQLIEFIKSDDFEDIKKFVFFTIGMREEDSEKLIKI